MEKGTSEVRALPLTVEKSYEQAPSQMSAWIHNLARI